MRRAHRAARLASPSRRHNNSGSHSLRYDLLFGTWNIVCNMAEYLSDFEDIEDDLQYDGHPYRFEPE